MLYHFLKCLQSKFTAEAACEFFKLLNVITCKNHVIDVYDNTQDPQENNTQDPLLVASSQFFFFIDKIPS